MLYQVDPQQQRLNMNTRLLQRIENRIAFIHSSARAHLYSTIKSIITGLHILIYSRYNLAEDCLVIAEQIIYFI